MSLIDSLYPAGLPASQENHTLSGDDIVGFVRSITFELAFLANPSERLAFLTNLLLEQHSHLEPQQESSILTLIESLYQEVSQQVQDSRVEVRFQYRLEHAWNNQPPYANNGHSVFQALHESLEDEANQIIQGIAQKPASQGLVQSQQNAGLSPHQLAQAKKALAQTIVKAIKNAILADFLVKISNSLKASTEKNSNDPYAKAKDELKDHRQSERYRHLGQQIVADLVKYFDKKMESRKESFLQEVGKQLEILREFQNEVVEHDQEKESKKVDPDNLPDFI